MENKLENTHKSRVSEYWPDSEMYVAYVDNNTAFTDTLSRKIEKKYIQFYFCTKGGMTFHFNNGGYNISLADGSSFLMYNSKMELPLNLSLNADSKVCMIFVSVEKLHHLFSNHNIRAEFLNSSNSNEKYYNQQAFSTTVRMVLNQIENHNLSTHFENLYVLGKVFELFTLYFSESEANQKENCPFLDNEKDARKLKEAKDILLDRMDNPPILKELSEITGLSEYKLKEGFKQVYGTTVYGFVLDKKLEFAREKLENGELQVKEIAFEIGYENPSHFIAAFKKKYGITPKQFSKQV
ncbi:helix-turn-helix domain-containing protein [Moheibacter lacus]|uniref:Helix-turn-helix transcriptional regulator n=1 Tax=Moheibacter lacus TaxID=2745851 RepID=A0A838ZQX7_9FLAO|nr:AraC family transcriptional regulator [Moheibacter lacus]MBA5628542.1 helix-turn-helix transcriptional regulator [Moheibacter lacus]